MQENTNNPTPPPIPPQAYPPPMGATASPPPHQKPLGADPAEHVPITSAIGAIDAILRHPRRVMFQLRQPDAGKLVALMLLVTIFCSLIYGVVVGTFTGGEQLWIAPAKVGMGLVISAIICLPSLYI